MKSGASPRVSVIIPSYNHERFVGEAMQSVLDQSGPDFEIVITDDGSSDGTVDVIKQFKDPRIRLFCFPQTRGACVAANNCLHQARGEYIAMLSSDDVFLPDKLAKQTAFLDQNQHVGAVLGYPVLIDEQGQDYRGKNEFIQPNRTRFEWLNYFFLRGNCLCHPSALIRKKCYEAVGPYDPRFAQLPDFDFWIRLCLRSDLHILPENLIKFRMSRGQANASAGSFGNQLRSAFEAWKILFHYTSPFVRENAERIFPHFKSLPVPFKTDSFEVRLACMALQRNSQSHKLFALDLLFEQQRSGSLSSREFSQLIASMGVFDLQGFFAGRKGSRFQAAMKRCLQSCLPAKLRSSLRKRLVMVDSWLRE